MPRTLLVSTAAALLLAASLTAAQSSDGSLRGYVKDEQGAVLPGVTVTASSPALIRPVSAVTDASGYYRLLIFRQAPTPSRPSCKGFRRRAAKAS
jgi:hypothetical protein